MPPSFTPLCDDEKAPEFLAGGAPQRRADHRAGLSEAQSITGKDRIILPQSRKDAKVGIVINLRALRVLRGK